MQTTGENMKTRSEPTLDGRLWQASRAALQPLALTLALLVGLAAPMAQAQTHTVTLHPGEHGSIAGANSGDDYVITVNDGDAFPSITVNPDAGWSFTSWNPAAPATVTNDFEATAEYAAEVTLTFAQIAEFEVDEGVSYVRDWSDVKTRSIFYGCARVDENGVLNLAYQDYQEVKFARIDTDGTVLEDAVVNTVSKKSGLPALVRNADTLYLLASQWDRRYGGGSWPTYASYQDAQLYSRSLDGGSWSQLHTIHNDVYGEAGGPDDIVEEIMPDPNGDIHLLYGRHGWWSYGYYQRERVVSAQDHSLGGFVDIGTRRSSHPDANRNQSFIGQFYLAEDGALIKPMSDLVDTSIGYASGVYQTSGETAWAATGSDVVLKALIRNDGNTAADSFTVAFKAPDGSTITTETVADLAALAETWVTAQTAWSVSQTGAQTISVEADSGSAVAETNEDNNTRTETLTIATARPDLVVSDLFWSPASPKAGDSVTITATIHNDGGGTVAAGTRLDTAFNLDGVTTVDHTLAGDLAPGGTFTVQTTWTAATGSHGVSATADSSSAVTEDYEGNNSRSETISVRAALPDLRPYSLRYGWQTVSGLSFSPSNPTAGDAVTIALQVWNVGTVDVPAGSYAVEFTADGTPITTETLALPAPLAPGASTTLTISWTASGSGNVTIAATVDSAATLTEENESNNGTSKLLTVYPASAGVSVSALTPSVWQPYPDSPLTLTATVVNNGGQPSAGGHVVTFYDGGPDAGGTVIGSNTLADPLAAKGGSTTASVNWTTPATPQTVTIYAVCEGTERTVDVIVTNTPAPDLAIYSSDISVSNPLPAAGDSVSIAADLRNLAGGESDVEVVFEYNTAGLWLPLGEPVIVYDLAAGETATVNATRTLEVSAYYYTMRVTLTPTAHTDANGADNVATTSFRRNDAPWANAGADQEAWTGQSVTLDGSASTNASAYAWTLIPKPSGSDAALTASDTVAPSFTPDVAGVYEVSLTVSDGSIDSPADTVLITATDGTPDSLALDPPSVAENAPADTLVGTLTATGGSGAYTYALIAGEGDDDNTKFSIDGAQLTVAGSLDYEDQATARIRVAVTDSASGNSYEETLSLALLDDDTEDGDNDGLTDAEEDAAGTSRTNPDTDGDGLQDGPEVKTHNTSPVLADSDGDSFDDGFEIGKNWNAADGDDSDVTAYVADRLRNSATEQQAHGLYTEDAIRNIHVGAPLIGVTNGEAHFELQLQKSDDLATWTDFGDPVEWSDPAADNKAFYRLFLDSAKP